MKPVVELKKCDKKIIDNGMNEKVIFGSCELSHLSWGLHYCFLGGNGAGKSTLFNSFSGNFDTNRRTIFLIEGVNRTNLSEVKRAKSLARVFQRS